VEGRGSLLRLDIPTSASRPSLSRSKSSRRSSSSRPIRNLITPKSSRDGFNNNNMSGINEKLDSNTNIEVEISDTDDDDDDDDDQDEYFYDEFQQVSARGFNSSRKGYEKDLSNSNSKNIGNESIFSKINDIESQDPQALPPVPDNTIDQDAEDDEDDIEEVINDILNPNYSQKNNTISLSPIIHSTDHTDNNKNTNFSNTTNQHVNETTPIKRFPF
jgi:hypothetical protein